MFPETLLNHRSQTYIFCTWWHLEWHSTSGNYAAQILLIDSVSWRWPPTTRESLMSRIWAWAITRIDRNRRPSVPPSQEASNWKQSIEYFLRRIDGHYGSKKLSSLWGSDPWPPGIVVTYTSGLWGNGFRWSDSTVTNFWFVGDIYTLRKKQIGEFRTNNTYG